LPQTPPLIPQEAWLFDLMDLRAMRETIANTSTKVGARILDAARRRPFGASQGIPV